MQREVDVLGNRCSFDEDDMELTEQTPLPITAIIGERIEQLEFLLPGLRELGEVNAVNITLAQIRELKCILEQVRTLEEAQQKKAKEERERIVGILKDFSHKLSPEYSFYLEEAIKVITN